MRSRTHRSFSILPALALLAAPAFAAAQSRAGARGWDHFAERHDVNGDGAVTRDELAQTSDFFQKLDRDGDGVLTQADFAAIRQDRLAGHLFRWADQNRDGQVTSSEWKAFTADHAKAAPDGVDLQSLFATYDTDSDGVVALADLPSAGFGFGRGEGMRRHFRDQLWARLDTNGDGRLSLDEWLAGGQDRPGFDAQRAEAWFKALDTNGDGYLSADERPGRRGRGPRAPR